MAYVEPMANPNMVKGAPSVNPSGKPFSRDVVKAARSAPGTDGVVCYSGYVQSGDPSRLSDSQKWLDYSNAFMRPPVAIAALLRSALLLGAQWTLTENESGGKAARKGLDVVQRGLLEARLPKPWPEVVAKASMQWFNGFSLHATALARRKDGLVAYTDIAHRPAHTIERWARASEFEPFTAAIQRSKQSGAEIPIPLADAFYLVNDTLGDGPTGVGVLRLVLERIRRADNYEKLEGVEAFASMGGMPVPRAPLEEIAGATEGDTSAKQSAINSATAELRRVAGERIKTPERQPYMLLDSATYKGADQSISAIKKWDLEIVKGELQGLPEIRKIISDIDLDIARMLGVEFVLVGGGDTAGSFGMHESKISMFAATLSAELVKIGQCATDQLARRLCAANGLDPDEACPTLVAAPIAMEDVEKTARTLGLLNMAGLKPNHPAKIQMFERMGLRWEDEAELGLPRMPSGFGGAPKDPAVPPVDDPAVDPVPPAKEPA